MGKIDKYQRVMDALPRLASQIDKKELVKYIIEKVYELVRADHTHVRVVDWLNNKLVLEEYVIREQDLRLNYPEFNSLDIDSAICGRVFRNKKSEVIPNAQEDKDFTAYLNKITNKELLDHLKRVGPVVCVPLLIEKKPIGVLTAVRMRKTRDAPLPTSFTKEDEEILTNFANYVAVALRNAWLFEVAIWQPSEIGLNGKKGIDLGNLCSEVVKEAKKRTGASEGRVCFIDWRDECLIPGTIWWHDEYKGPDLKVCVRKIGICPVGVAAEKMCAKLCNNLKEDIDFQKFINCVNACKNAYQVELKILKEIQSSGMRSESELLSCMEECMKGADTDLKNQHYDVTEELRKRIGKRIEILKGLAHDPSKFNDSLKKQIEAVDKIAERGIGTSMIIFKIGILR